MHLAFGRARTDRAPGDQVADVLRRNRVEQLPADGMPSRPMSIRSWRAIRRPSLMRRLSSRYGSLINPFHPTVVRGFSK